jgi:hypothetical protein
MSVSNEPQPYTPERLTYWYLRLNGFLTTENFVIHPDTGTNQRTDADLFAVRFANRQENLQSPMVDDRKVASCCTYANVIIAEVKTDECQLNGPWTDRESENMRRALRALGCVPDSALDLACDLLYDKGAWSDSLVTIRLFGFGETRANGLCIPLCQQITWDDVITFCINRFKHYRNQKSSVGQWTEDGRQLKSAVLSRTAQPSIRQLFGLHANPEHAADK